MALSRPLMNFAKNFGSARTLSSTANRFSAGGAHPTDGSSYRMWKLATYFFCIPVVIASTHINLGPNAEHHHRPEFVPYDYLRIRTKLLLLDSLLQERWVVSSEPRGRARDRSSCRTRSTGRASLLSELSTSPRGMATSRESSRRSSTTQAVALPLLCFVCDTKIDPAPFLWARMTRPISTEFFPRLFFPGLSFEEVTDINHGVGKIIPS